MKILLIRHGDPDYTIDSLTEKGWREAKLLSNRLEKLEIRDFYVSPLGRARATVQPTLEKLNRTAEGAAVAGGVPQAGWRIRSASRSCSTAFRGT